MLQTGRSGCGRDSSLGEVLRERSGRTSGASEGMSVAAGKVSRHGRAPTGMEGDIAGGNSVWGGGGCIPWAWESPSMKAGDDKGAQAGVG